MGSGRAIKSYPAADHGVTLTVKKANLTEATHYPDGYIPELTWFVTDDTDPGYVVPANGTVPADGKVYCMKSNTPVTEAGGTVVFGAWFTGVGFYEVAAPAAAADKTQAEAQGFSFWSF